MEGVSSAAPPAPASEDSDEEDFVDESIEDSIARELIALKAARTAGRRNINERGERDGASETTVPREKRTRPRFMSLQTGIECRALRFALVSHTLLLSLFGLTDRSGSSLI